MENFSFFWRKMFYVFACLKIKTFVIKERKWVLIYSHYFIFAAMHWVKKNCSQLLTKADRQGHWSMH